MKTAATAILAAVLLLATSVAHADETDKPTAPDRGSPLLFGVGLGLGTLGLANIPTGLLITTGGAQDVGHAMHTHALHSDDRIPLGVGVLVGSGVLLAAGTALSFITAPRSGALAPSAPPRRSGLVTRATSLAYAF